MNNIWLLWILGALVIIEVRIHCRKLILIQFVKLLFKLRQRKQNYMKFWRKRQDVLTPLSIFAAFVMLLAFVCILPILGTYGHNIQGKDLLEQQDNMRRTILQAIGGVFGILALWYTAKRVRVAEKAHENEVQVRITESYTKAIEQLGAIKTDGAPNLEVRLGAIYALERIAKDSPRDHWPIMEVLTAYVRNNAPAPEEVYSEEEEQSACKKGETPEIQAILRVLGRRKTGPNREQIDQNLDLSLSVLYRADWSGASLQNADLTLSYIVDSIIVEANFDSVEMYATRIKNSVFTGTDFRNTNFDESMLLDGVDFTGAKNLTVEQFRKTPTWRDAIFDDDFRAKLEAAYGNEDSSLEEEVVEES